MEYVDYLDDQIKRLNQIKKYEEKMNSAKKEKDKEYNRECMRILFQPGESFENFNQILVEYKNAKTQRKDIIDRLNQEIHIIKKLKS